jgi:hypothetical protein
MYKGAKNIMRKKCFLVGLILTAAVLLAGCLPNIESNIDGTKLFQTTPDYPHVFTKANVEMNVEFEEHTTRITHPETGDPFLYMTDSTNFYLITGNRENLRKVLASEGRIQFGFYPEEPRYAENASIDFILLPIENIIKATGSEKIYLEFIDASNSQQMAEYEIILKGTPE